MSQLEGDTRRSSDGLQAERVVRLVRQVSVSRSLKILANTPVPLKGVKHQNATGQRNRCVNFDAGRCQLVQGRCRVSMQRRWGNC